MALLVRRFDAGFGSRGQHERGPSSTTHGTILAVADPGWSWRPSSMAFLRGAAAAVDVTVIKEHGRKASMRRERIRIRYGRLPVEIDRLS